MRGVSRMAEICAHITGTVWKVEVKVRDQVGPGDVGGHLGVDEDGDAARG